MDQNYLNKMTSYLFAIGHINIKQVKNVYTVGRENEPPTTLIEYVDVNGEDKVNPLDLSLSELLVTVDLMPTVDPPPMVG